MVLLERICIIRIISVSLPITGSSLSCLASKVRFLVNFVRSFGFLELGESIVFLSFLKSSKIFIILLFSILNFAKISFASPFVSSKDRNKCSVPTNSSLSSVATFEEFSIACARSGVRYI